MPSWKVFEILQSFPTFHDYFSDDITTLRRQGDKTEETKSRLPAVITIVGALAVLAWWKRRGKRDFNGEAGNSSAPSRGQVNNRIGMTDFNNPQNFQSGSDEGSGACLFDAFIITCCPASLVDKYLSLHTSNCDLHMRY